MSRLFIFSFCVFVLTGCTENEQFSQIMEESYRKSSLIQRKYYESYLKYQQPVEEIKRPQAEVKEKGDRFIIVEVDLYDNGLGGWVFKKQVTELPQIKGPGNCKEEYVINYGLGNCYTLNGASRIVEILTVEGWEVVGHLPSWREVGQGIGNGMGTYRLERSILCEDKKTDNNQINEDSLHSPVI